MTSSSFLHMPKETELEQTDDFDKIMEAINQDAIDTAKVGLRRWVRQEYERHPEGNHEIHDMVCTLLVVVDELQEKLTKPTPVASHLPESEPTASTQWAPTEPLANPFTAAPGATSSVHEEQTSRPANGCERGGTESQHSVQSLPSSERDEVNSVGKHVWESLRGPLAAELSQRSQPVLPTVAQSLLTAEWRVSDTIFEGEEEGEEFRTIIWEDEHGNVDEVCSALTKEHAQYIVDLHNRSLSVPEHRTTTEIEHD